MDLPETEENLSMISTSSNLEEETRAKERKLSSLEKKLVEMVMTFNLSVTEASEIFFREQGRKNYVTPTSYLEMLRSFKILYENKFKDIIEQRDR